MPAGVFVYGSLMSFKVLETLIFHVPKILPAYIPGMTRLSIRAEVYPGIMKTSSLSFDNFQSQHRSEIEKYLNSNIPPNEFAKVKGTKHHVNKVQGLVLKNLTEQQMQILDHFESEEYEKQKLPIVVGYDKNWNVEEAFVYVYQNSGNLYDFWDFDNFCSKEINSYLEMCANARVEFFNAQPKPPKYTPLK